jgi:hypothetical protein
VIATSSQFPISRLRSLRGIAVLCVLLAYLFTGALHGACHLDAVAPASDLTAISMPVTTDSHHSGHAVAAGHHCHACFSVTVPAPVLLAARAAPAENRPSTVHRHVASLAPSIDTPPPKLLT